MSAFQLVSSETLPLTAAMVKEHLEMTRSPTERELSADRIKYLRAKADAGQLTPFAWSYVTINGSDVKLRMNGQHSATMLQNLIEDGTFPEGLKVHMDHFQVDNLPGAAVLFRQIDARKSARSPDDVAGAYQGIHPELADVGKRTAKIAAEGIAWHEYTIEGSSHLKGDDIYSILDDSRHWGFIRWIDTVLVSRKKVGELLDKAVIAAAFATFQTNEDAAKEFWEAVAKGGDDPATDPAVVLDAWLVRVADKELRGSASKPKPGELYQGCVYAWNAFREGREIKSVAYRTNKGWLTLVH